MKFKVVVQETARHEVTVLVQDCTCKEHAKERALDGDGIEQSDIVSEWLGDSRVLSCKEVDTADKVYRVKEDGMYTFVTWSNGNKESCIRTEFPMQVKLIVDLLHQSGHAETPLPWPDLIP